MCGIGNALFKYPKSCRSYARYAQNGWIERLFTHHILVLFSLYDGLGRLAFFLGIYFEGRHYIRCIFLGNAKRKWAGFALPMTALGISFITAYYMGKQLILVFLGSYRGEKLLKMPQKSWIERAPILVLAILSFGIFYRIHPLGGDLSFLEYWLGTQPKVEGNWVTPIMGSSILLVLLGLGFSYWKYGRQGMREVKSFNSSRLSIFVQNGFYLDKFYMGILVPSFDWLAFKTSKVDTVLINPFFNKIAISTVVLSKVTDLFDRLIVDGLISLIKSVVQILGSMFTKISSNACSNAFCFCDCWISNNTGLVKICFIK